MAKAGEKDKNKNFILLYIVISLAVFFISCLAYLFLLFRIDNHNSGAEANRYFLKDQAESGDPFMTKNYELSDIINGPIISGQDPYLGNKSAPVIIAEYSDFECSFCREQEIILKKILNEFENEVYLIWKDYPEKDQSSFSFQASLAARCAQEQNEFWPYHDLLYDKTEDENKDPGVFTEIAKTLKLNSREFASCLDNGQNREKILDNIAEANALGIEGIPFIFINDKRILGAVDYEELKKIITDELNRS